MQKDFAKLSQTQIITGFNTVAIIVMLVWVIRTNLEFKNNIEELRKDINEMKTNGNENNKRSTLSLSRLSQRLEDLSQKVNSFNIPKFNSTNTIPDFEQTSVFNHSPRIQQEANTNDSLNEIDNALRLLKQ